MAALEGRKDIVEILLAKGADVNVKRNDGVTALMSASREGHKDVVEQLLAAGADVIAEANDGGTALMMAAQNGHKEAVKLLLAKGADVNAKTDTSSTALILASQEGHEDVVELLLAAGADVNAKANTGATALMLAARGGYTEIVKLFIDRQTNLNLQASNGATALSLARLHGHQDIVKILIAAGARDHAMLQTPKQGPRDAAMTNEDNFEAQLEESTSPEPSERHPTDDDLLKTYNTVLGLLTKRQDPQNAAYFMTDGEAGMFTRFRADVAPFLENQDDKGFALKRWWMQRGRRGGEGPSYGVVAVIVASPYVRQKNFKKGPGNYALTDLPAISRRIITRAVEGEARYGTVGKKGLQGFFDNMLQHINVIPEGQVAISQGWVAQVKAEIKRLNNQKKRNRRQRILVMMSEEEVDEAVRLLNAFIAKEKPALTKRDEHLQLIRSQEGVRQDLQENLKIRSRQFFEFLRDNIGLTDLARWSDRIVVRRPVNTRREVTLQRRTALQSMAEVFALLDDGYVIEKISSSGRLIDLGPDVHSTSKQDIFNKMETVQNNLLISNLSRYVSERPFDIYFNFDLYGQQVKKAQHQQMGPDDIISLINYVKTAVSNGKTKIEISDKDFDWKITPTTRNMVIEALNLFELPKKKLIVPSPERTETSHSWRVDIGVEDTAMVTVEEIDRNKKEAIANIRAAANLEAAQNAYDEWYEFIFRAQERGDQTIQAAAELAQYDVVKAATDKGLKLNDAAMLNEEKLKARDALVAKMSEIEDALNASTVDGYIVDSSSTNTLTTEYNAASAFLRSLGDPRGYYEYEQHSSGEHPEFLFDGGPALYWIKEGFGGASDTSKDKAMNGGIDLNQINVLRNGKTVNVQFDPAQLNALIQGGFEGFTPVIINITHISSPFQLLGINPAKQPEVLAKA